MYVFPVQSCVTMPWQIIGCACKALPQGTQAWDRCWAQVFAH